MAAAVKKSDLQSGCDHYVKYGRHEGRLATGGAPPRTDINLKLFESPAPSPQAAVDVFSGHSACNLDKLPGVIGTGTSDQFTDDRRPQLMADTLGNNGRLDGMSALEIGPLEGAHSYAMDKLGAASILAVESNREAWLKCLVVKGLLSLSRTNFVLGDINEYLEQRDRSFDAIMCSGVLYHMSDPVGFIRRVASAADRCFVWTHFVDEAINAQGFTRALVTEGELQVEWNNGWLAIIAGPMTYRIVVGGQRVCGEDFADVRFRHEMVEAVALVRDDQGVTPPWLEDARDLLKVLDQICSMLDAVTAEDRRKSLLDITQVHISKHIVDFRAFFGS